jgi:hypothetical protein
MTPEQELTPDQKIYLVAQAQHGLVSRVQALTLGLKPDRIQYWLQTGRWSTMLRGVYALPGAPPRWPQPLMAAVLAAGAGAVASHRGAAALHGLPGVPRRSEVTVPASRRVDATGFIVHASQYLDPSHLTVVDGIPVTTVARTLADLAAVYDKNRLGDLVDEARMTRRLKRADLVAVEADLRNGRRNGISVIAELLAERPAGERPLGSKAEKRLLAEINEAGLPVPRTQVRVVTADGREWFIDFGWEFESLRPGLGTVNFGLEALSKAWHDTAEPQARDVDRNAALRDAGWMLEETTALRINQKPRAVVAQVGRALARYGHPAVQVAVSLEPARALG